MEAFRVFVGEGDMLAYLTMMAPRLVALRQKLKSTGSLYLHCDPTASHYLKVLLDAIFGRQNFRSEVIWRRSSGHNKISKQYGPIHDTLLFYSKSEKFFFKPGTTRLSKGYVREWFTAEDDRGAYRTNMLTGPGTRNGESGRPWRGFDPTTVGRHWAIPASLTLLLPADASTWTTQTRLDALDDLGFIYIPRKGKGQPKYKQYVGAGMPYQDVWAYQPYTQGCLYGTDAAIDEDVKWLQHDQERVGFQTQKPEGLLARIVHSSCPDDGVVLDPFCGCGTTISVAQNLHRSWVGVDITARAIDVIVGRLDRDHGSEIKGTYQVLQYPYSVPDALRLARDNKFHFQRWALERLGVDPSNIRPGADKGIDGKLYFSDGTAGRTKRVVLSVKGGQHVGPSMIRDLRGVLDRDGFEIGVLVTAQRPTALAIAELESGRRYFEASNGKRYRRLQYLSVEDIFAGKRVDFPGSSELIIRTQKLLEEALASTPALNFEVEPRAAAVAKRRARPELTRMAKASMPGTRNAKSGAAGGAFDLLPPPRSRKMVKALLPLGFHGDQHKPRTASRKRR
jgi:site-specific DNA-methyltransferase (adenine-specific)